MNKIILFMAYYGKLPSYFDIWLEAIKHNYTVNFCLITDCLEKNVVQDLPQHIKVHNISFEEFKQAIQDKFDFKISLNNYGRISQFRPAFAYIFPELVKSYDFWGYIECDLILGDIRHFLTDALLSKYDKFFKLGHMQVFRNNEEMNKLFMHRIPNALDYKFAFSHNIFFFEEVIGMYNIARTKNIKLYEERVFTDCKYMYNSFIWSNFGYPELEQKKCLFEYDNGKLYRLTQKGNQIIREETLYAHFQKRALAIKTNDYNKYLIVPNEFIDYKEIDCLEFDAIVSVAEKGDKEYYQAKLEKDNETKKKNMKSLDWWLLYMKRQRIKHHGGVGLSGNAGEM